MFETKNPNTTRLFWRLEFLHEFHMFELKWCKTESIKNDFKFNSMFQWYTQKWINKIIVELKNPTHDHMHSTDSIKSLKFHFFHFIKIMIDQPLWVCWEFYFIAVDINVRMYSVLVLPWGKRKYEKIADFLFVLRLILVSVLKSI